MWQQTFDVDASIEITFILIVRIVFFDTLIQTDNIITGQQINSKLDEIDVTRRCNLLNYITYYG